MTLITRRRLINSALAGAAGLSLTPFGLRTAAAKAPALPVTSTALGGGLSLLSGAGGNVVAAAGPDGVLLVDGGLAGRSRELLGRVATVTGRRRVEVLFNTHWHWDHTGSNETLARHGATIVAHENTKEWLGAEIVSKWENRTYRPRPAAALPTRTFYYGTQHLSFGGEGLEYGIMPQAHTDGDIYVFFPRENVLVAGGVVAGGSYPIVDYCTDGWLGGMTDGLQALIQRSDGRTRIVPGAGPVRSRADLQAQLGMCSAVLDRIYASYYKGETWEELVASRPTREFDAAWGDPGLFLRTSYESVWGHITDFRRVAHALRADRASRAGSGSAQGKGGGAPGTGGSAQSKGGKGPSGGAPPRGGA